MPAPVLNAMRRLRYRSGVMELHWIAPDEVRVTVESCGGRVLDEAPIAAAPGSLITKQRYCVLRSASAW